MVAGLAVVAVVLGLLVSESASAASFDGGALTVGTTTTLTAAAAGDTWTYTVDVPGGRRLTLTTEDSATPINANVAASASGRALGNARIGNRPGDQRLFDVDPAAGDRTLTLQVQAFGQGTLPLTPGLLAEPAPQTLAWATPTTATVGAAGQQAALTFQGVAGHRLGVTISGSTFPTSTQATVKATVRAEGQSAQTLVVGGATTPGLRMTAVPYTLVVDGVGPATGSLTVRIDDVTDIVEPLVSGATQTADLSTVWTQVAEPYRQVVGGHLRVEVLSSTLRQADGSPGSAKITSLNVPASGYQLRTTIGTVTDQPVTFTPAALMGDDGQRTLEIVPDGRTTGTLTYRLTVGEPVAAGALAEDRPTTVTVPAARTAVLLTAHVGAGDRFTIAAGGAALTSATGTPQVRILPLGGGLVSVSDNPLLVGDGAAAYDLFDASAAGGDVPIVVEPTGDTTGSVTLTLHKVTTVTAALVPGQPVTATAGLGDTLTFTAPAGADVAPVLTVAAAVKGIDGTPQTVDLDVVQNGTNGYRIWGATATPTTTVVDRDVDPTQPWQLAVVWPAFVGTSGSVTVTLAAPHATTTAITSGGTTTVALPKPGDLARLTLAVPAGRRIAWRSVPTTGVRPRVRLTDAAGAQLGHWDETGYAEVDGPATAGTVTFTVENLSTTGGSLTLSAWAVTDPVIPLSGTRTIRWGVGQNPRITFQGRAGTHAILDVSAASWSYVVGATPPGPAPKGASFPGPLVVRGPDGSTAAQLESISAGMPNWLEIPGLLTATGTYTILLEPQLDAVGSITAALRQPTDLQRRATLGTPVNVQAETPGQNAVVTVTVPEGTSLTWTVRNSRFTDAALRLESADGTVVGGVGVPPANGTTPGAGTGVLTGPLAAGTYRLVVDPQGRSTGSAQLTLAAG